MAKESFFWVLSLVPLIFLDPSLHFNIMFLVWALLLFTTEKPSNIILQHIQSSFTPEDFPSSLVLLEEILLL